MWQLAPAGPRQIQALCPIPHPAARRAGHDAQRGWGRCVRVQPRVAARLDGRFEGEMNATFHLVNAPPLEGFPKRRSDDAGGSAVVRHRASLPVPELRCAGEPH
jgi:hypothetical protein